MIIIFQTDILQFLVIFHILHKIYVKPPPYILTLYLYKIIFHAENIMTIYI